jgi:DNA ligase (NAD+)
VAATPRVRRAATRASYRRLCAELAEHAHRYYVLDAPTVADGEYDALYAQLLALEAEHPDWTEPHSPSQRVGARATTELRPVQRRVPMLSLSNVFDRRRRGGHRRPRKRGCCRRWR